jgi:hypothetical protein
MLQADDRDLFCRETPGDQGGDLRESGLRCVVEMGWMGVFWVRRQKLRVSSEIEPIAWR